MRLREPKTELPKMVALRTKASEERTFRVELITPLYGGGVEPAKPDQDMPVRVAAIRGQLRFWWRLLNRKRYPRSTDLYKAELAIWGGLSDRGATASRVALTVNDLSEFDLAACATYNAGDGGRLRGPNWHRDIHGYVMFPGQGELNRAKTGFKEGKEPADVILSLNFSLTMSIRTVTGSGVEPICENDVLPSLRWWASFGGLGARTRRGLGSVKVEGLDPVTVAEAGGAGCMLVHRPSVQNPNSAWKQAINKLQTFRQGVNVGRNPGIPPIPAGRSRWPEADSIREITGCHYQSSGKTHTPAHPAKQSFPRVAFGMPIITHFKDSPHGNTPAKQRKQFDPEDTALVPKVNGDKRERMASPVILKAMWMGDGYAPIALLLPHDHIGQMRVMLDGFDNSEQPGRPWWPKDARTAMTTATSPNPLDGRTGDVLADFLDFFRR